MTPGRYMASGMKKFNALFRMRQVLNLIGQEPGILMYHLKRWRRCIETILSNGILIDNEGKAML
jgi:hypothetical protein